ncbi:MAG: pyruvate formate lyase family protein, partial [Candidatus Sumerlaeia bacterium]
KPTPPQSSKQYLFLGGVDAEGKDKSNDLSALILEAAMAVHMREPVLNVRWHPGLDSPLKDLATRAASKMQGQIQFCNDRLIPNGLIRIGINPADAHNYAGSGCSRIDAGPCNGNHEAFFPPIFVLMETLEEMEHLDSIDALIDRFAENFRKTLAQRFAKELKRTEPYWDTGFTNEGGIHFHLESLLIRDCVDRGLNLCQGGARYVIHAFHLVGFATLVDSFVALEKLICSGKMSLGEFKEILQNNYADHEPLRRQIRKLPAFGNDDPEADDLAERLAKIMVSAIEELKPPQGHHVLPSFYSLLNHRSAGANCGATPDGRLAGEPLSENQSPTYGRTEKGITALFNSLWRLPFDRATSGGLNVMLMSDIPPKALRALIDTYFSRGGSILGPTFTDRAMLEDAKKNPEHHADLLVRIHGFSDWFVGLPEEEQKEVIERTNY